LRRRWAQFEKKMGRSLRRRWAQFEKKMGAVCNCAHLFYKISISYLTFSTTALKASGWFIARSASVFLLRVIPF
jgi:hypothetical protein